MDPDDTPLSLPTTLESDYWLALGFKPAAPGAACGDAAAEAGGNCYRVPKGLLGFAVSRADAKDLAALLENFPVPDMLILKVGDRNFFYCRVDADAEAFDGGAMPATVRLIQAGDLVPLPSAPAGKEPPSLAAVASVAVDDVRRALAPKAEPEILNSPLTAFSLRGSAAEFERIATDTRPLLGDLCMAGQATLWYAPPNAGKTLITLKLVIDAVADGRINPANIYYVNADDSSSGFAEKMRLMDDMGAHTLSPGHKGLRSENLITVLHDVAAQKKARGSLVIMDTVKKFVTLMDKAKASAFSQVCRQVVMGGGTILGLAHTTKNPNANGTIRYAGTTDMVDDFDAAYTMTPLDVTGGEGEKVVRFDAIKRRGNNVERIAYAYASEGAITYEERLASVRTVDPDQLDQFQRAEAKRSDAEVIAVVAACIAEGVVKKIDLARAVAKRAKVAERAAIQVIEAYTGDDPAKHHWTFTVQARGAKVFALLPPATPDASAPPPG